MRTRTLLILAAVCGVLILLAGGVKLLQVANDPVEVTTLELGDPAQVGDMTATVLAVRQDPAGTVLTVRLVGVDGADAAAGWRLGSAGEVLQPVVDDALAELAGVPSCHTVTVSATDPVECAVPFAPVETLQAIVYTRAGEQANWVPPTP